MAKKRRADRAAEKRRAAFLEQQQKIRRRRTVMGVLALVTLAVALLGCGGLLSASCGIVGTVAMVGSAAFLGSSIGLTIRLILDRRRFARETTP